MKKLRSFRIEDKLWLELKEKTKTNRETPSNVIRRSIKEYLNGKK